MTLIVKRKIPEGIYRLVYSHQHLNLKNEQRKKKKKVRLISYILFN